MLKEKKKKRRKEEKKKNKISYFQKTENIKEDQLKLI